MATYKLKKEASGETNPAVTLVLDFPFWEEINVLL